MAPAWPCDGHAGEVEDSVWGCQRWARAAHGHGDCATNYCRAPGQKMPLPREVDVLQTPHRTPGLSLSTMVDAPVQRME
eukprot:4345420-Prymnesium_polylepis.2